MSKKSLSLILTTLFLFAGLALPAWADGGVTFSDAAADPATGIDYQRAPSPDRMAKRQAIYDSAPISIPDFVGSVLRDYPMKAHGAPGIALLDYDVDGDLDVYVTNGPGAANNLYSSQLEETGQLTFIDVGVAAGVDATAMDATGVCFGDIDNDGDPDLYVVGTGEFYRLYQNMANGTFRDITNVDLAGDQRHANGCTMADVNNDGLLDIVVANSYDDWLHRRASNTPGPTYEGMEHNYLFLNLGVPSDDDDDEGDDDDFFEGDDFRLKDGDDDDDDDDDNGGNETGIPNFVDVTVAAGLENVSNMSGPGLTGGALTWAIGSFDYDQDGDIDILCADNQGQAAQSPDQNRGWLRLYDNDGTGTFTEVTNAAGLEINGGWMGLAFGDYNCDGHLDFFGTNLGDFLAGSGARSRFYYGSATGAFTVGGVLGGPEDGNSFGWGSSPLDYDNDGDLDVVYHGSVDRMNFVAAENPGVLMVNQGACSGTFGYDVNTFSVDHAVRNVHGVAAGDLNGDGFTDIVSASAFNLVPDGFYFNIAAIGATLSPLIPTSFIEFVMFNNAGAGGLVVNNPNLQFNPGNLVVEINNAENGNNWVKVKTRGSIGNTEDGSVNRDGIGAVVKVTPANGPTVIRPVVGGSSYASQDALELVFGLGSETEADIEILWPGGVRNSLQGVSAGESILFPEIPCSIDSSDFKDYKKCAKKALKDLRKDDVLTKDEEKRFLESALDAFGS